MQILSIELDDLRLARPTDKQSPQHLLGQFTITVDAYGLDIGNSLTVLAEIEYDGQMPLQDAIDALIEDAIRRLTLVASLDHAAWKSHLAQQWTPYQSLDL